MFESTYIIAKRQSTKARQLLNIPVEHQIELEGSVASVFQWMDMTKQEVKLKNGITVNTCPAAMGYSFAAGTTDGPGEFDFIQGTNISAPFWKFFTNLLNKPSPEQEACHAPKPIHLNTGPIEFPYKVFVLKCISV